MAEKNLFRSLMLELAEFCQVRILTYCIMSNHFHILLEVPKPPEQLPNAEETFEALGRLSSPQNIGGLRQQLERIRESQDPDAESRWLGQFHARRWNLSKFMQALKQRFSANYNRKTKRHGTLWEDRFKSVLVEGDGHALVTMAAYIDLNPVRARIVQDPKDYLWSGYGEAVAGKQGAQAGLQRVVRALLRGDPDTATESLEAYRQHLFVEGNEEGEAISEGGETVRGCLSRKAVLRVLAERGKIPTRDYLRCRVRYFCDGAVFGSRKYVESIFQQCRERFGPRRTTGARRMLGLAEPELFTVRALRINVFC
jgi:REP element-mobilizing transposase RayT